MLKRVACVDIDGVLFDVELFKKDYLALFERVGVSPEVFKSTYGKSKAEGYYDVDAHLRFLEQIFPRLDTEVLRGHIKTLLAQCNTYLFSDAVQFLKFLKNAEYDVFLLSTGTAWFQEAKVRDSTVVQYVDQMLITKEPLKNVAFSKVHSFHSGASFVVVDDTPAVINALKTMFPDIFAVQVLRSWEPSQLARFSDVVVPNLREARESIARLKS